MPYEWSHPEKPHPGKQLRLWPHRSLPRKGFVAFIGGTAVLIALPLLTVLGTPVLWGVLPFLVVTVSGLYWALQRSYRDGEILETLTFDGDCLHLERFGPRGKRQEWQANPHWVQVRQHETGGPVPQYITLSGGPREVELGAFLSDQERAALAPELRAALRDHNGKRAGH